MLSNRYSGVPVSRDSQRSAQLGYPNANVLAIVGGNAENWGGAHTHGNLWEGEAPAEPRVRWLYDVDREIRDELFVFEMT
jgi:hypothetical protein